MAKSEPNLTYVADMLNELRKIALDSRQSMLAHLLAMAELEARQEPDSICAEIGRAPVEMETKCFQKL